MTEQSSSDNGASLSPDSSSGSKPPTRTPLYQANSTDRYHRQAVIKQIQDSTKRTLICYASGSKCAIDEDDIMPFVDLLHNVPPNHDVDLMLHTKGGSIDAAEKLMGMLRSSVGEAQLRIIVPDFAKSAGTLMVLGADSVVMSDMSELGPIDPQVHLFGRWQSAQNYLDAYKEHERTLKVDPDNIAARIMLGQLDPATLKLCEAATNRASQAAEKLLRRGMFRKEGNWSKTASVLLDTRRWRSHGQMISWEDARDPEVGLVVEYHEYHSQDWQDYWQIHCLQRLAVGEHQKLYESDYASLIIGPASAQ